MWLSVFLGRCPKSSCYNELVFYNYQNKTISKKRKKKKKKREREREKKFVSVGFASMSKLIAFGCNQLIFYQLKHGDILVSCCYGCPLAIPKNNGP